MQQLLDLRFQRKGNKLEAGAITCITANSIPGLNHFNFWQKNVVFKTIIIKLLCYTMAYKIIFEFEI